MKKILSTILLLSAIAFWAQAQAPQLINFQAGFRNSDGLVMASQSLDVMIILKSGSADGETVYTETQSISTDANGIANIVIGSNDESEVFPTIPWDENIFVQIDIKLPDETNYTTLDVSPVLSVPYAIFTNTNIAGDATLGQTLMHNGEGWLATSQLVIDPDQVGITAKTGRTAEEPIFLVRNSSGQIVFAVYESGVEVKVEQGDEVKGTKGGFAVGGLSDQTKLSPTYLSILPDEVQFNILQPTDAKSTKGGFAVGGLSDQTKAVTNNILELSPDSATFLLRYDASKGTKGGFAVGGLSDQTKGFVNWLRLNRDTTYIQTQTLTLIEDVVVENNIVVGGEVNTTPVKDIDGNTYKTVSIGNQVWMAENLRSTKFRNGTAISTDFADTLLSTVAVYDFNLVDGINSNEEMVTAYGRLYNWNAIANSQGLCPTGWAVPSNDDWVDLIDFLKGDTIAGALMKSRRVEGINQHPRWNLPNTQANNISGFTGLPGGYLLPDPVASIYSNLGLNGYWWSQTENDPYLGYVVSLAYDTVGVLSDPVDKKYLSSVRCIKVDAITPAIVTSEPTDLQATSVIISGTITDTGGATILKSGVVIGSSSNPTIENNIGNFKSSSELLSFDVLLEGLDPLTTFYARTYATNKVGTSYGNEVVFTTPDFTRCGTVTDIDGNVYQTIQIGDQCWIDENLKTTSFRNGTTISTAITDTTLATVGTYDFSLVEGINSDEEMVTAYGRLYNWNAITNSQGLCPTGWALPTNDDWLVLIEFLQGNTIAGSLMKSKRVEGVNPHPRWNLPNTQAYNTSGFTGLPGGNLLPDPVASIYSNIGLNGYWWSQTENDQFTGNVVSLAFDSKEIISSPVEKKYLSSVRCIKVDAILPVVVTLEPTEIQATYTIISGSITDTGGALIENLGIVWDTLSNPTIENNLGIFNSSPELTTFDALLENLDPLKTYYARAFASNKAGTTYGNEVVFTTLEFDRCGTVTDMDGNVYQTIQIGDQCWMAENLKTTKYFDGRDINNNVDLWGIGTYYPYEPGNEIYGLAYNGIAALSDSLCPIGSYMPSEEDFNTLITYLGGQSVAGEKLKAVGDNLIGDGLWESPNLATNASGFTALPGGVAYTGEGFYFENIGFRGVWWSNTEDPFGGTKKVEKTNNAETKSGLDLKTLDLYHSDAAANIYSMWPDNGANVRCIWGQGKPRLGKTTVNDILINIVSVSASIISDGGDVETPITSRGFVISTSLEPTVETNLFIYSEPIAGTGIFSNTFTGLTKNTLYYVRAFATNANGTSYGVESLFKTYNETVSDIETNVYYTSLIGDQHWMAEDLRTTKYNNDTPIPNIIDPGIWSSTFEGAYVLYDQVAKSTKAQSGYLYNWYTVSDTICPVGWRVPFDIDWNVLENYLGENAGGKLKSTDTVYWDAPNAMATNESGFTGYGTGYRTFEGNYWDKGWMGYWWTATQDPQSPGNAFYRGLSTNDSFVTNSTQSVNSGLSIRCIEDDGKPALTTSFATDLTLNSATSGGNVYYSGASPVSAKGVVWDISPSPTIETNLGSSMDGVQDGIFESLISGLNPNTTYYVRAYATSDQGTSYGNEVVFKTYHSIITDINTNNYFTIEIGTQLWMAQNLKATSFSNDDAIPVVSPWNSFDLVTPAYTYYDYNSSWLTDSITMVDTYGMLYNGYVATDARNVCPIGWHVPTQPDVQELISYLGGENSAGGKLKSVITSPSDHPRWDSPNEGATNETGFSGIPSGYRDFTWGYSSLGTSAIYWSSTMDYTDYYYRFDLNSWDSNVNNYSQEIRNGLSIRCVKD